MVNLLRLGLAPLLALCFISSNTSSNNSLSQSKTRSSSASYEQPNQKTIEPTPNDMQQYTSNQEQILRSPEHIYQLLSNFENLSPLLQDKVEDWQASTDRCSFKAKGFSVGMRFEELIPHSTIKVVSEADASPIPFIFWIQLKEAAPNDTRIRLVLEAELNTMMNMMIGSKIQKGLDGLVKKISDSMNS